MKTHVFVCVLCLFAFGCGGDRALGDRTAKIPQAATDAEPKSMSFDWPVPAVVQVRDTVFKNDLNAELQYDLHICPHTKGLIIDYQDFEIVSLKGPSIDPSEVQSAIAQLKPLFSTIPSMIIGKNGTFIDIQGWEEAKKATLSALPESRRASIEAAFNAPQVEELVRSRQSEIWSSWTIVWQSYTLQGPREQVFVSNRTSPAPMESEFTITRQNSTDHTLHLRMESVMDKTQLGGQLNVILGSIAKAANLSPDQMEKLIAQADMQRTDVWEVVTNPRTLKPRELKTEMKTQLSVPGRKANVRLERHHYRFDWDVDAKSKCPN